jgi:hypothetical protein
MAETNMSQLLHHMSHFCTSKGLTLPTRCMARMLLGRVDHKAVHAILALTATCR